MFWSYMWTIFRLRFLTYRLVIQDVWSVWVGGGGTSSRCSMVGTMTPSCYKLIFSRENPLVTTWGHGTHY